MLWWMNAQLYEYTTIELYIPNGWSIWYVNYVSIKKLKIWVMFSSSFFWLSSLLRIQSSHSWQLGCFRPKSSDTQPPLHPAEANLPASHPPHPKGRSSCSFCCLDQTALIKIILEPQRLHTARLATVTTQLPMGDTGNGLQSGPMLLLWGSGDTPLQTQEVQKVSEGYIISVTHRRAPCTCLHGTSKARGKTLMPPQDNHDPCFHFPAFLATEISCYQVTALAGPWRPGQLPHWRGVGIAKDICR